MRIINNNIGRFINVIYDLLTFIGSRHI